MGVLPESSLGKLQPGSRRKRRCIRRLSLGCLSVCALALCEAHVACSATQAHSPMHAANSLACLVALRGGFHPVSTSAAAHASTCTSASLYITAEASFSPTSRAPCFHSFASPRLWCWFWFCSEFLPGDQTYISASTAVSTGFAGGGYGASTNTAST